MIKSYYAKSTNLDFGALEDKGLTHVIASMGYDLSTNPTTAVNGIDNYLNAIETTNLKLILGVLTFKAINSVYPDPGDPVRTSLCASNITELSESLDVEGFITDDYVYPNQIGFVSPEIEERNRLALVTFADEITEAVHDGDSSKTLCGSTYRTDYYNSTRISWFGDCFDYLSPQIYRNVNNTVKGVPVFGYASHQWVAKQLDDYLIQVGDALVLPALITYNNDQNAQIRTMQDISADIDIVLKRDVLGYGLYASNHVPDDLSFPDKFMRTFSERTYSNRNY